MECDNKCCSRIKCSVSILESIFKIILMISVSALSCVYAYDVLTSPNSEHRYPPLIPVNAELQKADVDQQLKDMQAQILSLEKKESNNR